MATYLEDRIGKLIVTVEDEPEFVIKNGKQHTVYNESYHCSMTGDVVDKKNIFEVQEGYILDKHALILRQHPKPHNSSLLNTVPYIVARNPQGDYARFVFNVGDTREGGVYASTLLYEQFRMPKEIVDLIMQFVGCPESKPAYSATDFQGKFVREYKGNLPSIVSKEQVKRLYSLGLVKMAVSFNLGASYTLLTDESFDRIYSNKFNFIKRHFKTKEMMHACVQATLDSL